MFSLLRVNYLRNQSNDSHLLTSRNKLLGRSWKWLFLNKKVSHSHKNLSVSCYLSNYYCSRKLILSFIDQHAWVPLISLRSKFYFSLFLDMKIWASCACILNSKLAAPGPIQLKLGQIVVRCVTYKTVSASFNYSFHFIAYFSLAIAIISHPRIYLLVKIKRAHIPEI